MTSPAPAEQQSTAADAALVSAVLGLLVIGASAASLAGALARLLRVRPSAATAALNVIGYRPGDFTVPFTPAPAPPPPALELPAVPSAPPRPEPIAQQITERAEQSYRAAFLTRSTQRIDTALAKGTPPAAAVDRERRLWALHIDAQNRRTVVARRVDEAAAVHGLVLGWHAVIDTRTSPECRAANGNNFRVDQPPTIGFPGAVHPRCRCLPAAPWPSGGWVDYTPGARGGSGFERSAASG